MTPPRPRSRMQGTARFRFHAELNDFLPPTRRKRAFDHAFRGPVAIKDVIEALGVPHPEVDAILVDGRAVRFSHRLRDGERIDVYPDGGALREPPPLRLRPRPLRITRFVLDAHLGALARYLRMLGFDALYRNDYADAELARIAHDERRILLTRDVGLLKRSLVRRGCFLRQTQPLRQMQEIVARFELRERIRPFRRCMRCNGHLAAVRRSALADTLDPRILARHRRFRRCRDCARIYWPGSHFERMQQLVALACAAPQAWRRPSATAGDGSMLGAVTVDEAEGRKRWPKASAR